MLQCSNEAARVQRWLSQYDEVGRGGLWSGSIGACERESRPRSGSAAVLSLVAQSVLTTHAPNELLFQVLADVDDYRRTQRRVSGVRGGNTLEKIVGGIAEVRRI